MNLANRLNIKLAYDVNVLITHLKANRDKHVSEYKEALKNYRFEVEQKLLTISALADKQVEDKKFDNFEALRIALNSLVMLTVPKDAEKMYDQYINMLGNTISGEIELSAEDANAIINDGWDWAVEASLSNSTYLSSRK
jgi:hypothetical protein